MTPEELAEWERQFLEERERRTATALPTEIRATEERAREAAYEALTDGAVYRVGPQASQEDLAAYLEGAEAEAQATVDRAKDYVREPGMETAWYDKPLGRSRLVVGTGGQVVDEETGDLREASAPEQLWEALWSRRIAEAHPFDEKIRMVREGEATREEVMLPEWVDLDVPPSQAGIEEPGYAAGLRFLGALEPFVGEALFGSDILFYDVDEEGQPVDPEAPAYQAEQFLKDYLPDSYMEQGMLIPAGDTPFSGNVPLQEAAARIPRPFQGTTRHRGLMAAPSRGDYVARVADQIAEGRSLGDEFVSLPLYEEEMRELYGETVMGMPPAFLAGTAWSTLIPTPLGPLGTVARGAGRAAGGVARYAGQALRSRGMETLADIAQPWQTAKRLANRAAARAAVGVDLSDIRDPLEAPTLRSIAVGRAVGPVASAVELKGVATEAMEAGGTLNWRDMAARFGGDHSIRHLLRQAYDLTDEAIRSTGEIDPRVLDDVVENFTMAADYKLLLDGLTDGTMSVAEVKRRLAKFRPKAVTDELAPYTGDRLKRWLQERLRAAGMVPNTKNGFVAGMYSMARTIMGDMSKGVPVDEILTRSIKGMGAQGRLFQDNLLRAIMEEAQLAGKDVARLLGRHARKAPTPARLKTMVQALGEGRGQVAIGKAFRETMTTVARDRILQHLPDDYVFVSGKMMVLEKQAAKARRAIDRMARELFDVAGSPEAGRTVRPVGDTTVDDLVRMFVQEAGPVSAGAGPGSSTARAVLRKLKQGTAMNVEEHAYFAQVMRDAVARRVAGSIEAVTEGAQTALARNSVALRNALYTDAYSKQSVGRLARGARTTVAALGEVLPVIRKANKGNAAASLLVADDVAEGATKADVGVFDKWYRKLVAQPAARLLDPFYGYAPESSVISETYARRIADVVGSAADRVGDRLAKLSGEGLSANQSVSRVVMDFGDELDRSTSERFVRSVISHLEGVDQVTDERLLEEAMLAARYMVSQVKMVATEGVFKQGEGVIDTQLRAIGVKDGVEGLRTMPVDDAVKAIRRAVVRATAIEENGKSWVTLLKTLMPGKAAEEIITGGANRSVNIRLSDAVNAVRQRPGAVLDRHGNLLPNVENSRAVLELLAKENGADVLDATLDYSGVLSVVSRGLGTSAELRKGAWKQGVLSWLVHQRAGIDAGKLFTRMADENPEMVLDLMPAHADAARRLQAFSAQSIIEQMMKLESDLTGKAASRHEYDQAFVEAMMVLRGRQDDAGLRLSPLAQSIFWVMKDLETIDFALTAEQRVALGTNVMRQMARGRGGIPDLGSTGQQLVRDLLAYNPRFLGELDAEARQNLKTQYISTSSRYQVSRPFQQHVAARLKQMGSPVQLGQDTFAKRMTDAFYHGVLNGTEQSLLGPIYRQFDGMWRRAGLRLDAGDIPGLDGPIIAPTVVRAQHGATHFMAGGGLSQAVSRVEAAVASGRLQARLEELSVRAMQVEKGTKGKMGGKLEIALTATLQLMQTTVRTVRSSLLAGGGPGLAILPNPLYHAGNVQSVPELLFATLGADMAVKALAQVPEGAKSMARNATSLTMRNTVARALAPVNDPDAVVINSAFYGDITARELDEMMDLTGIKFSRASIESYESIGEQLAQQAKMDLGGLLSKQKNQASGFTQFMRLFNPASMNEWMRFAEDTDGITRRATFIAALADGRSIEESAMLARESLLDYGKVAASGTTASQFMQRWTMYWAFRRQSLIMTLNNLADGEFGRQELMGRWIRLQGQQKKGASPEEFLFGPEYTKLRMYITPDADEVGFTAGAPSVLSEGAADLLGWMAMFGTGIDALGVLAGDALEGVTGTRLGLSDDEFGPKARSFTGQLLEAVSEENLDVVATTVAELVQLVGRMDDKGPLVSDVFMAQLLGFDSMTGSNVTPAAIKWFDLVVDRDPETGEPVVTPGRPYLQSEGELIQRPHQFRFRTMEGYVVYSITRAAMAGAAMGRTPDEYTKLLLTIEPLVPEGFHPQYRALAGTLEYMTRTGTPMRVADKEEARARVLKRQQRQVERAAR